MEMYSPEFFMHEAYKQALMAYEDGEIPVGAVMVCKNRIIARAYNQTQKLTDVTAHAEILAITSASSALGSKYLNSCSLYVTLEPCVMCAGACFWAQLGSLHYAARDIKRGYTLSDLPILHPKTIVSNGIMAEQCKNLIDDFFRNLRN